MFTLNCIYILRPTICDKLKRKLIFRLEPNHFQHHTTPNAATIRTFMFGHDHSGFTLNELVSRKCGQFFGRKIACIAQSTHKVKKERLKKTAQKRATYRVRTGIFHCPLCHRPAMFPCPLCHRPAMSPARYVPIPARSPARYVTGPLCPRPAMPQAIDVTGPLCPRPAMSLCALCRRPAMFPYSRYVTGPLCSHARYVTGPLSK